MWVSDRDIKYKFNISLFICSRNILNGNPRIWESDEIYVSSTGQYGLDAGVGIQSINMTDAQEYAMDKRDEYNDAQRKMFSYPMHEMHAN